jgi:hypothetical protein
MMAVFSEFIEEVVEVFMDDSSVYGKTFMDCLANLDKVLTRCVEVNLVLNWEKCHFMVKQGIVLGHVISERGIEVDKAKVETVEQLPPPMDVKSLRSFLDHAGFYRRFIKDYSKITKPLTHLLQKDVAFDIDEKLLTPKFGKVRSLTCGSNAVRNPSGKRKVSLEEFGKRVRGRQFASVRQENCCADFAGLRGDVARAEGTNGWISDRI